MNRPIAFLGALLFAAVSVSSACFAQPSELVEFTLRPEAGDRIHARFERDRGERHDDSWSTGFTPSELIGLEVSSFHASGTRPLHFSVVREAGRLDCAGNGGSDRAIGTCRFAADPGFMQLLASRGIGRPTGEQAFGLMAVNARREVIDAVAEARYPTPSIDNLMALAALNVDGRYIRQMAQAGYRPRTVNSLVEFKALGITPEWIGGFARIGYANVPGDDLVQLRALGVTPDFIEGFRRIGYRDLAVDKLVELKALNITPEFVRASVPSGAAMPAVGELVELKLFGRRR